jgi:hypothetical protein
MKKSKGKNKKPDHDEVKVHGRKIFLALPGQIISGYFSRFQSQLSDEMEYSYVGMGKPMKKIVQEMPEADAMRVPFLSAGGTKSLFWLKFLPAIKACSRGHIG